MSEGNISAWMPETDQHVLAALGKLAEECNELAGRAARSIIQGLEGIDPASGRTNLEEIGREVADVIACIYQAQDRLGIDVDPARTEGKNEGFDRWHDLIDAVNHGTARKEPGASSLAERAARGETVL